MVRVGREQVYECVTHNYRTIREVGNELEDLLGIKHLNKTGRVAYQTKTGQCAPLGYSNIIQTLEKLEAMGLVEISKGEFKTSEVDHVYCRRISFGKPISYKPLMNLLYFDLDKMQRHIRIEGKHQLN